MRREDRRQPSRAAPSTHTATTPSAATRSYILCTEDQIIHPDRQRAFAALLGVTPIEIASEHSVFATKPQELASILDSLAG